jgi:hypothetical protein
VKVPVKMPLLDEAKGESPSSRRKLGWNHKSCSLCDNLVEWWTYGRYWIHNFLLHVEVQTIFAWLAILGFLPLIVRATMAGTLSVELAVLLTLLMVVAVCIGVKKFVFKVAVPIAGVVILSAQYAHGDTQTFWANLSALLTLSLVLLGFYFIISGLFRSKR